MKKIAFIGAGSFGFTRTLVRDILSYPAFSDATIALMDINQERLDYITKACEKIVKAGGYSAKIEPTLDRIEALKDADGVVITVLAGDVEVWRHDIEIPKEFGVDINVGDTRGPSGIFRYLRTAPLIIDICKDVEKHCPNALVLNYTNPMAMLCRTAQTVTNVNITGLCHSVQGTAKMLADWLGADMNEVEYICAGINHQAFYTEYKVNGQDAYPRLKELINDPEIYNKEQVRNEMFKALDYYVTESSGHNSEYNAWFRKRPDLLEKYCTHGTGWNVGLHRSILDYYLERKDTWKTEIQEWLDDPQVEIERGEEYAANIFNAVFGDNTPYEFNGNLRNFGYVDNLPEGCCVEVPVVASKAGLAPQKVGKLPSSVASLVNASAYNEELAIEGFLTKDKKKIYQSICTDPLTSAVLSLEEIKEMVDRMFEQYKDFLGDYK